MEEKLLSIVVPVYNVEPYLRECLDSLFPGDVPEGTYEVICVDDGSPDNCGSILDEYALSHPNMTVIHQKNAGVSAARNRGLDQASGKYLWFVDSDDFISSSNLQGVLDLLERSAPDQLRLIPVAFSDGEDTARLHAPDVSPDKTSVQYAKLLWTFVYRRQIAAENGIRFHETLSYGEDDLFILFMRPHIKSTAAFETPVYFYRNRENSLSTAPTEKRMDVLIRSAEVYLQYEKEGKLDHVTVMSEVCPMINTIMDYLSTLPYCETEERIRELKKKGLFPLKKQKSFRVIYTVKGKRLRNRILKKLQLQAYTRSGYYRLRIFRFLSEMKRKI